MGKTTVCAVLAQLFERDGLEVLAIDADSNPNLAMALGVPSAEIPQPLIDMKELIQERTESQKGVVGQYFKLNPDVADLPEKYWHEVDGIKLLVLGGIEDPGGGCACPEAAFLKALLTHSILRRKELILVDLPAGVEFLGRACVQGIDMLVIVVEPGSRSIETARNIARMGTKLGIETMAVVANKVDSDEQFEAIKKQLGEDLPLLGDLRYAQKVKQADLQGKSSFEQGSEFVQQLNKIKDMIVQ